MQHSQQGYAFFCKKYLRSSLIIGLLLILLLGLAILNIWIGAIYFSISDIFKAIIGIGDSDIAYIITNYRLPRIVIAIFVGTCLAVSGAIAQSLLLNPLAAPDTLGITGGAAIGAVLITLLIPYVSIGLIAISAFAGGIIATIIVYLLSYQNGINPIRLALIGVAVSSICGSFVQLILTSGKINANTALLWLNGSLWGRNWEQVIQLLPIMLLLLPAVFFYSRVLNIIRLGDLVAKGLGLRIETYRLLLLTFSVLLASNAVAAVGMLGFVGLVSPHIARKLVGQDYRLLIPTASLIGSLLVLLSDSIGRSIIAPVEIPVGIVTAILGAPYFLFLLWQESKFGKK
jgi:ferric citrate transport system permease protein